MEKAEKLDRSPGSPTSARSTSSPSLPPSPTQPAQDTHDTTVATDIEKPPPSPSPAHRNKDAYLVDWEPNDPANPKNWSRPYKAWITFQLGMLALAGSLASSIIAPAQQEISTYSGVSYEVTVLAISLYILGFAFGPLCWAPISEAWGRKWSILPAVFCRALFSVGTATSQSFAAIAITRFFGGLFGSAPISNVSAALGDMYYPKARGTAVTFYAVAVIGGPAVRLVSVTYLIRTNLD